ncbi:uncharacterized protein LOC112343139 [Selaginella moellendorffii]|uniref:uncharacterized protein LOC112343139 n=1 Tax=Selaginella moellendorffii TaxID=88036 RepID=UPI000D1C5E82|nr:uncharacterized protein LOC112343139 [Selaginella moellendorffii]|eukprot:XP_024521903.1 uncharacterized protein LOC112343139 [Selaginella moellendorffii]
MCAIEDGASSGITVNESALSLDSLSGGDEGSSSVSSLAEEEEIVSGLDQARSISSKKRVKMMCSYGGRILPRPHDNQLRYMGGETRILVVKKEIAYKDLMAKLSHLAGKSFLLKYQLPNEDLDALVSVTSDEDVKNMMDEFDKMVSRDRSSDGAAVKLRVFLFDPHGPSKSPLFDPSAVLEYSSDESVMDPSSTSSGSKFAASPPLLATNSSSYHHHPPRKSKMGAAQQLRDHEFGSLKAYQRKHQAQDQHHSPVEPENNHSERRGGMFYNQDVPSSGQLHPHHYQFVDGFTSSEASRGIKPPCHCCAAEPSSSSSSMLPPRHPVAQRSLSPYHHHSPVRTGYSINETQAHFCGPRYYNPPSYSHHHHPHHHHHLHHLYNNA